MHAYRPILTQHRLQRYILWALAMLAWVAAVLGGDLSPNARHLRDRGDMSVASLTRLVRSLLCVRALNILRHRQNGAIHHWRYGRCLRPRHFMRSLLGSKLRRALKHKNLATHIAQLIAVLRNLDAHAAHLARSMRKRRRLWRTLPPIAPAVAIFGAPAPTPAFSDSS